MDGKGSPRNLVPGSVKIRPHFPILTATAKYEPHAAEPSRLAHSEPEYSVTRNYSIQSRNTLTNLFFRVYVMESPYNKLLPYINNNLPRLSCHLAVL